LKFLLQYSDIFQVAIYFFAIFHFSIFQNYLTDDTSGCKGKLSKFNSQNISPFY